MPIGIDKKYNYIGAERESRICSFNIPIELEVSNFSPSSYFWESKETKARNKKLVNSSIVFTCPMAIFPPAQGGECFYDIKKFLKIAMGNELFERIENKNHPILIFCFEQIFGEGDNFRGVHFVIKSDDPSREIQDEIKVVTDRIHNYLNDRMDVIYRTVRGVETDLANKSLFGRYPNRPRG